MNTSVVPAGTGSSGVSTRGAAFFAVRAAGTVAPAQSACTHTDPSAERAISAAGSMGFAQTVHRPAYLARITMAGSSHRLDPGDPDTPVRRPLPLR